MKKIILLSVFLLTTSILFAQVPSAVIDIAANEQLATQNVSLINMQASLLELQVIQEAESKRLVSTAIVTKYIKYNQLLNAVEDAYCVLSDLADLKVQFDSMNVYGDTGCVTGFEYITDVEDMENNINRIVMALSSPLMTVSERSELIDKSYAGIIEAKTNLDTKKVDIEKKVTFNNEIENACKFLFQ